MMGSSTARLHALTSEGARLILTRPERVARVEATVPAEIHRIRRNIQAEVEALKARIALPHGASGIRASIPPDHGPLSRSVLVVEDDADCLQMTAELLQRELGIPVFVASTAEAGREEWWRRLCAVVVSDLHLGPGLAGDQLLEMLPSDIGRILLSGTVNGDILERAAGRIGSGVIARRKPPETLVEDVRGELARVLGS